MHRAVIFDMNGVLVDDERFHQQSWRQFCQRYGFALTESEFHQYVFGRTERDTLSYLFKKPLPDEEVAYYSQQRVEIAMSLFKPLMRTIPGVVELLHFLRQAEIPLAVATSSRKRYQAFIFDHLNLWPYFRFVVTAEDVACGKPDPEVYLKAAALLQVPPHQAVAIEDSLSGIRSAQAAGMKVIGVATTHTKAEIQQADKVVANFTDQSPAELLDI